MTYIVASIGRSGSTLISKLIAEAKGLNIKYVSDISIENKDFLIKTHSHFRKEPEHEYRAIFIYGNIYDAIYSMMHGKVNLKKHLVHLEVKQSDRRIFWFLHFFSKTLAFKYIVKDDKLRFKENIVSWQKSKNTLFVDYDRLETEKKKVLEEISEFLNLQLSDFEFRKRESSGGKLSNNLKNMIDTEYEIFFESLNKKY